MEDVMPISTKGLSPPTRGIHLPFIHRAERAGSIPAYAGDPRLRPTAPARLTVYPRLRGGSAR